MGNMIKITSLFSSSIQCIQREVEQSVCCVDPALLGVCMPSRTVCELKILTFLYLSLYSFCPADQSFDKILPLWLLPFFHSYLWRLWHPVETVCLSQRFQH